MASGQTVTSGDEERREIRSILVDSNVGKSQFEMIISYEETWRPSSGVCAAPVQHTESL